jgi:hypothetical protein
MSLSIQQYDAPFSSRRIRDISRSDAGSCLHAARDNLVNMASEWTVILDMLNTVQTDDRRNPDPMRVGASLRRRLNFLH